MRMMSTSSERRNKQRIFIEPLVEFEIQTILNRKTHFVYKLQFYTAYSLPSFFLYY